MSAEFFVIERQDGVPLADAKGRVVVFSRREYAQEVADSAAIAQVRILDYRGDRDVVAFLERIAKLEATHVVVDPGKPASVSFALRAQNWTSWGRLKGRALAMGIEVAN